MRRSVIAFLIMALAALPLLVAAQEPSPEGFLFPEGAHPREPTTEVMPPRDTVRNAQLALREAGFDPGPADGIIGPRTQAALREFQVAQGLPETGRLDATTQQQLMTHYMPERGGTVAPAPGAGIGIGR